MSGFSVTQPKTHYKIYLTHFTLLIQQHSVLTFPLSLLVLVLVYQFQILHHNLLTWFGGRKTQERDATGRRHVR